MHKINVFFTILFFPFSVFANIDVDADIPSGTYHAPIHITLTPTEDDSKTFYSFKPDGYPQDAFLYTGSILLKNSSPLIYFSIVSPTNESRIKQNNYIIEYSSDVRFGQDVVSGSWNISVVLANEGTDKADIGLWQVQSESDTVTVPEGTVLSPGQKYVVRLHYSGNSSVVLRSPDDEEKDILVPQTAAPSQSGARTSSKKSVTVRIVPRKLLSTEKTTPTPSLSILDQARTSTPENDTTPAPVTDSPREDTVSTAVPSAPSAENTEPATATSATLPQNAPTHSENGTNNTIGQVAKVSVNESQQSGNPLFIVALLALSAGIGGMRWIRKKNPK